MRTVLILICFFWCGVLFGQEVGQGTVIIPPKDPASLLVGQEGYHVLEDTREYGVSRFSVTEDGRPEHTQSVVGGVLRLENMRAKEILISTWTTEMEYREVHQDGVTISIPQPKTTQKLTRVPLDATTEE